MVSTFPLNGFVYTPEGTHGQPVTIGDSVALRAFMFGLALPALEEGREVIVTDIEDYAVLHFKDKRILWPKEITSPYLTLVSLRGPTFRVLLNNKFYTHTSSQREAERLADTLFNQSKEVTVEVIGKSGRGAYYYRLLQKGRLS